MKTRTRKPAKRLDDVLPFDAFPLTGTHCADCGSPQRMTPGGASCTNGHGGAPALEETRAALVIDPISGMPIPKVEIADAPRSKFHEPIKVSTPVARDPRSENEKRSPATARHFEGVTLFEVETTPLVQIDRWPAPAGLDVRGALVKLAPVIKASERASFDAAAAKRSLLEAGAIAVALAPRVVPDGVVTSRRDAAIRRAAAPHEAISAWFETAAGLDDDQRAAATDAALGIYDSAVAAK